MRMRSEDYTSRRMERLRSEESGRMRRKDYTNRRVTRLRHEDS